MIEIAPILFSKLSAAGNDFLIVAYDDKSQTQRDWPLWLGKWSLPTLAQKLCDRTEGIGADGLLILSAGSEVDWTWDFYNRDGSQAEMCGNLARCAHLWACRQRDTVRDFTFGTLAGVIRTSFASPLTSQMNSQNGVQVMMPESQVLFKKKELSLSSGSGIEISGFNTGVPHAVIEVAHLELERLRPLAMEIRSHSSLWPQGTNVTFVRRRTDQELEAMTFERGVEDFTKACGTGAVAAGLWNGLMSGNKTSTVQMPGGTLWVEINGERPLLMGPVHWVADLYLHIHKRGVLIP